MLSDRLKNYRLILGSASPRRRELLASLGLLFEVAEPGIAELVTDFVSAEEMAIYLAAKKAEKLCANLTGEQILITADTVVLCNGHILPKPGSREEAVKFLKILSGCEHSVITGVCIMTGDGRKSCFSSETYVTFSKLDDEEIDYYVDHYEPYDKAGAYGIQEWIGYVAVEKIEGSYFNVMGLPVNRLYRELKKLID